jgi:cytochrome c-type biogenesis protein CcmF
VGGSLSLFAWRGASLQRDSNHGPFSREMFLLLNNLFLLTATVIVLLGTLFPLIADALALGKFSVGPPYFNLLFVPLTLLLLFFMGIGPATNWKKQSIDVVMLPLRKVLLAAVIIAIALPLAFFGNWPWQVGLTVGLCVWVFGSQLVDIARKSQHASTRRKGLARLTRSYWGMQLAHLGLLVTVLGVAFTSAYSIEKDVRLAPGESITVNGYAFRFDGVKDHQGPNYVAQRGTLEVSHDGFVEVLHPEKRIYRVQQSPMTEAAITGNTFRDLYVALGEPLDAGAWAVRIYHKPMIRWIWFGALMMALGGLLSMLDKRYRLKSAGGR